MAVNAAALLEKVSVYTCLFCGICKCVFTVILGGVLCSLHAAWGWACVRIVLHSLLCIHTLVVLQHGQPGRTDDTALLIVRCVLGPHASLSLHSEAGARGSRYRP
jgi:hypothetical protein